MYRAGRGSESDLYTTNEWTKVGILVRSTKKAESVGS